MKIKGYLGLGIFPIILAVTIFMLISSFPSECKAQEDGIVDNSDPGFSVVGTWGTASEQGQWGNNMRYHAGGGSGSETARWVAELTNGFGLYEVFVWHYGDSLDASDAPFTINHNSVSDKVIVDQRVNGSQWVSLGYYDFADDGKENVTLSNRADSWVIADAVRFVPIDGIVDNADPGFSVTGTWIPSTALPDFYGSDYLFAGSPDNNNAIWNAELTAGTGDYEVSVWYPMANITLADMPFTINHAGLSDTILIDPSVNGGQWVRLGTFYFSDDGKENVTLSDNADTRVGWVVADAVRFIPMDGIVDNGDLGFSVVGTWHTYSRTDIPIWGTDGRYHVGNGTGDETATWEAELIDGPGSYEVFVFYNENLFNASNAPFTVNHAGVSDTALVDQRIYGGIWFSLGTFDFADDGKENVTLSDDADGWVIADAVKFVPGGGHVDGIVDNTDPGFNVVGIWATYSDDVPEIYGTDLRYNVGGGVGEERATWVAELTGGHGSYEVFIWYYVLDFNASDAPFTINHNGISDTVRVDQTINGGQWVSLGSFYFSDDGKENVILSDDANGLVVADAVMFVPDGIVDNLDPGFSIEGIWGTYSANIPEVYGTDLRYNVGGGTGDETAIWVVELIDGPGSYEVFVWYYALPFTASNAPFTINHNDVSDTVLVDQTI
ncbi:MAG: hypothetical protein HY999_04145, partial [Nitrospinae bacterium]|nr:hypothetical protein [Nitrospinota bacterium]